MGKGTERERREAFEKLRSAIGGRMESFDLCPRSAAASAASGPLMNSDGMLWHVLSSRYGADQDRPLMSEVASDLGVNEELTRLILLGKREPSKAFLDAVGYERVMLYRRKGQP